jgi:flavin-dependent dehydrogenase
MSVSRDVVIVGGGLAGLSLAIQLQRQRNDLAITVLERQAHPVPVAAHKVGESTVEIGAQYLSQVIGLEDHLKQDQLRKFGLRFFFGGNGKDLAQADELGVGRSLTIPSYQLDRGILENELGQRALKAGIDFRPGTPVTAVATDTDQHTVRYRNGESEEQINCRWLVDAASRTSPLKRKLGLARQTDHAVNAAWFRIDERIEIDQWSDNADWHARCTSLPRWLSTNHLMGPGYWVWLIPLSSKTTSVGIVADPALHPLDSYNSYDKARTWLATHEPRCRQAIGDSPAMDFRFLKHFSHGCSQVYSADRWALSGEAGVFLDPFYSPGSDFIAISNSYISNLILGESRGENIARQCRVYQQLYFSFFESTLALYQDLYPGFGDRDLMVFKTVWDYAFYWGILAQLFFAGGMFDEATMLSAGSQLLELRQLNLRLQGRFRERAQSRIQEPGRGAFVDQGAIPCLLQLNRELANPLMGEELLNRLSRNATILTDVAARIERRLSDPRVAVDARERELFGDLAERLAG